MRAWFTYHCRFYCFAFFLLLTALLRGQESSDWVRFGLDEGLSNLQVNDIDQCEQGFIWLATNEGLRRFDGEFFVNMPIGSSSPIQNSTLTQIAIDDGIIWLAATNRGLYRFDIDQNQFEQIPLLFDTMEVKNIQHILLREEKVYLSVHNAGVIVLNKNNPLEFRTNTVGMGSAMSTIPLKNDSLLAGQLGVGYLPFGKDLHYDLDSTIHPLPRSIDSGMYSAYTCEELHFEKDHVWLGCWDNALHQLNLSNRKFQSYLLPNETQLSFNSNEIVALTIFKEEILVATKFGEIFSYNQQEKKFSPFELIKFKGKKINSLFVAEDDRLWIGTSYGLFTLKRKAGLFKIFSLLTKEKEALNVNVLITINDSTYVGTNQGLYLFNNEKIQKVTPSLSKFSSPNLKTAFENQPVHSLLIHQQFLFIGTNKTVYQLDRSTKKTKDVFDCEIMRAEPNYFIPNDNKFSRYSTMVVQDTEHGKFLWAFAYGHFLTFYHLEEHWGGYTKCYSNYQENLLQKLIVDEQNVLHGLGKRFGYFKGLKTHFSICSADDNFNRLNFKEQCNLEFVSLRYEENWDMEKLPLLNSNDFRQIIFHNNDRLLCSSSGLYQMNEQNEIKNIPLPYNDIQNALKQKDQLWLISNGRLLHLNLTNYKNKIFSQKNGIPAAGLSAAMSLHKGQLILGGKGFLAMADTEKLLQASPGKFPFFVSACRALRSGNAIEIKQERIQNHEKEGGLILSFATLTYPNANEIQYQYKISSIGDQWIDNGKNNDLVLAGLESGEHVIAVRALDANGELVSEQKEILIAIQPYWYNRLWFKIFSILLLLGIAYGIYKIRRQQQSKIIEMRNDISRDLHDDIGSLLGSISIYSESALNQIEFGNKTAAISILDKIGTHARTMIDKMSDIVWSIHSEKDSLEDLTNRMKIHGQGLCAAKNISFKFQVNTELVDRFDMRERKNIFLIYKEFMNNSLKHSKAENIVVSIESRNNKIFFEFKDDGIGFDPTNSHQNGFGLLTMQNRAKEMKGEISIYSEINQGTKVQLAI